VPGDPHGTQEVDPDLVLDVGPSLPLELSAHTHSGIVDQGVQTCKRKKRTLLVRKQGKMVAN